jgi:ribosome biogenesis protein UTP30
MCQTLKASRALLAHIKNGKEFKDSKKQKRNLLADADEGSGEEGTELDDVAVWLILTTKRHIIDKTRLKPGKMCVSLNPVTIIYQLLT